MRDMFDGVQLFVEVVEAGGFTKAGERLSLTRSAVGKAIARLEVRLGVQLFQRTTRTQALTEEGQQYYERCVRAIEELRTAETILEHGRREVAGRLHVSLPVLFGRYCVAPILRNYAHQHPQLELALNFNDRHVDLIADGFDLAVRSGPLGNGTTLRARRLGSQRKILCASPDYLAARGEPRTLADLADHDLLAYWCHDRGMVWQLPDATGALVNIQVTSRLRFDDLEVLADTAAEGMGLAWLPDWLLRERIRRGELIGIWGDRPGATLECHVVWPAAQYLPLRCRLAIDMLAAELPKYLKVQDI
ncbi:LysR family transcriptional regulator [Xylella taiwanensis]|uniref:LysR family transcriptional regulator n=2 Tax=Xylella taiwanensis TaxID=1444770 RepID=Z9JJM5_9GAMM|nr:LysR family transcriptional regulator [Xylella taiwanensis]AXI82941.1 LysR family transcriptional regulator [Xylella taiwanensis]EWS78394.1 LysR family transcriptional regulator [Xylella taiwanensis]MCD8455963.1 LysR family transcriptional regulator [Xylella taiwanensis]MCD8458366.1 LysR family transcriptional regulator [Xylella taiwanensis]MCD8460504.1 LysR family transcriptional regulator [Xylella taiwanensis]